MIFMSMLRTINRWHLHKCPVNQNWIVNHAINTNYLLAPDPVLQNSRLKLSIPYLLFNHPYWFLLVIRTICHMQLCRNASIPHRWSVISSHCHYRFLSLCGHFLLLFDSSYMRYMYRSFLLMSSLSDSLSLILFAWVEFEWCCCFALLQTPGSASHFAVGVWRYP